MLRAASLAIFLSLLWLLLSGYFTEPLLLGLGVASVLSVVFITYRMGALDPEGHPVHLIPRALVYWPWLLKEIVMANIDVAKAVLRSPDGHRADRFYGDGLAAKASSGGSSTQIPSP